MTTRIALSPSKSFVAAAFSAVLAATAFALPAQAATADDAQLAAQVKSALAQPWQLERADLNVAVVQGRVHLTGWADQPSDVALAREKASQVPGVTTVDAFVRTWSSDDER